MPKFLVLTEETITVTVEHYVEADSPERAAEIIAQNTFAPGIVKNPKKNYPGTTSYHQEVLYHPSPDRRSIKILSNRLFLTPESVARDLQRLTGGSYSSLGNTSFMAGAIHFSVEFRSRDYRGAYRGYLALVATRPNAINRHFVDPKTGALIKSVSSLSYQGVRQHEIMFLMTAEGYGKVLTKFAKLVRAAIDCNTAREGTKPYLPRGSMAMCQKCPEQLNCLASLSQAI